MNHEVFIPSLAKKRQNLCGLSTCPNSQKNWSSHAVEQCSVLFPVFPNHCPHSHWKQWIFAPRFPKSFNNLHPSFLKNISAAPIGSPSCSLPCALRSPGMTNMIYCKKCASVISQSVGLKIYHPRNFIFCAVYLEIVLDEHISIIFPGVISCPQKSPSFANKLSASSHVQRSPRSQAPARKNLQRVFLISLGAAKSKIVDESHSCKTTPKKRTELEHPTMKIPMKKKQQKDFKRGRSLSFQKNWKQHLRPIGCHPTWGLGWHSTPVQLSSFVAGKKWKGMDLGLEMYMFV